MKKDTLKILDGELSLQAEGCTDIRKMLKKVQFICRVHGLKWGDVQHKGFTMMVEPDSDIEALAAEFEEWEKNREGEK